ncbi:MAG: zinc-dependent metalloprotease [Saprospiraceae bacterium]|nr:zinc-dependent metalloprotease [Saprospiraceae bacterium]MDW8230361.1 zinc-dependent metalloprotease [Saprospiraceae bacterium]
MKALSWLFALWMGAAAAQAQPTPAPCGTPTPAQPPFSEETALNKMAAPPPYVFSIFVHILRNDDGSNAAMSDAVLADNLQRMADFYRPHNICFTFVGRDFIDNTGWNTNYMTSQIGAMHAVNPHNDAIDIYVHRDNFQGSGGNSYSIPSVFCSVAAPSSFNFEHEMGHCLGLWHTFETAAGAECPDGSNCASAGDQVCDTPADYSGSQSNSGAGCTHTGTQTINCNGGTFGYDPPTRNIMSYWWFCYSEFTAGQAARMYNTINATAALQNRLTPQDRVISNATLLGEIAVGAQNSIRIGNIGGAGDVLMTAGAQGICNAGRFVRVEPGTRIAPTGANSVLLTINDLCEGLLFKAPPPTADRHPQPTTPAALSETLEAFPNPFNSRLRVRADLGQATPAALRLFDMSGRLVREWPCPTPAVQGRLDETFDLPDLPAGVYLLQLQHSGGRLARRVVKAE